jgi:hypothetical protein
VNKNDDGCAGAQQAAALGITFSYILRRGAFFLATLIAHARNPRLTLRAEYATLVDGRAVHQWTSSLMRPQLRCFCVR